MPKKIKVSSEWSPKERLEVLKLIWMKQEKNLTTKPPFVPVDKFRWAELHKLIDHLILFPADILERDRTDFAEFISN